MEHETINMPLLGDKFPELNNVQTTQGLMNIPADFKGKWFVLFSHPADFTPVCTTEFIAFQNRYDKFKDLNCELIGLSIDQVFAHIEWVRFIKEKFDVEIKFPIIAGTDTIANKLGMLHPGKGSNTVRAVFIVDPKGITRIVIYYPQEIGRNLDEVLRAVKALQTHEANGVAMPENWPNNEMLKDKVIIPPAKDVETASKRTGEYECYAWWFCYKEL
ncbi:MAG: peroxiredoxin [Methanosarcinaceae archaeon]|jgi:peroxiredoxin (alkyl hydroperoxide reductase subunit C)|nr:peroxiredoxin [Methanosarcinaceae archaeon]